MKTSMYKGTDGWQAKTDVDLGPTINHYGKEGRRVLRVSTYKNRQGLVSKASVHVALGQSETHMLGLGGGGDFSKNIIANQGARCTEKAILTLHNEALLQIDALTAEAKAHYESAKIA